MKRHAPATARNSAPIADVLDRELPVDGTVLEIASGTGEHAVYFANRFPYLRWQPSDRDVDVLISICEWRDESGLTNIANPIVIDAATIEWPISQADAIFCCNMVHISPWAATEGLFAGASTILSAGAPLILYGPFIEPGIETAPSNISFDRSLKERDPRWGLRSLDTMNELAEKHRFVLNKCHAMPANNLTLVYRKTGKS